jgi:hypothetical protein
MAISEEIRARIRIQSQDRCGYCLSRQMYVLGILHIEHIIPKARGGTDNEENLWLACSLCNTYKGAQTQAIDPVTNTRVALFNPRQQNWSENFTWSEEGLKIAGLTPCGRATIIALQLNNRIALTVRQQWISAGWHPS